MSSERSRLLASISLLLLGGCLGSSPICSGEFVAGNEECDPGCPGIMLGRAVLDPDRDCYTGEPVMWCVRPAPIQDEEIRCHVDERTGDRYVTATHPIRADVPPWVRPCVGEESNFLRCE